jgi:glycosyltransferase involved in cell wall biosynthesis
MGIHVDVLEIKGIRRLKYLQTLPSLMGFARTVDLVHAHYGYCGWLTRLQLSKPVVVSFMGSDLLGIPDTEGNIKQWSKLHVQIDRFLARTVDAVIVKSDEMAKVVAPVEAYILPNGVDLKLFRPMDRKKVRSLLGWPEDQHYILFPGDPDLPRKGFRLAEAVLSRAAKQMIKPPALVKLKGIASHQVPLYMNACDVMVMTSFIEGSPNVVKEAMACNLPVVAVPVGDVPELLAGVPGYSICSRDVRELSEALLTTLADVQRVDGRTALKRKGLDQESVAHRLVGIYSDVLRQRKNAQAGLKAESADSDI